MSPVGPRSRREGRPKPWPERSAPAKQQGSLRHKHSDESTWSVERACGRAGSGIHLAGSGAVGVAGARGPRPCPALWARLFRSLPPRLSAVEAMLRLARMARRYVAEQLGEPAAAGCAARRSSLIVRTLAAGQNHIVAARAVQKAKSMKVTTTARRRRKPPIAPVDAPLTSHPRGRPRPGVRR